jgi:hypothetical protein
MSVSIAKQWTAALTGSPRELSRDGTVNGFIANFAAGDDRLACLNPLTRLLEAPTGI